VLCSRINRLKLKAFFRKLTLISANKQDKACLFYLRAFAFISGQNAIDVGVVKLFSMKISQDKIKNDCFRY